jgi:hypothetical protein
LISPVPRAFRNSSPQIFALIVGLALAWLSPAARGQGFDATTLRQPIDLASGFLVHGGDDPAYARSDFDDSHWTTFNADTGSLHTVFPNSQPEVVWYRLHIKLAPDEHNLSLHTTSMPAAFEIFVNGVRLAGAGSVSPYDPYDTSGHRLVPIPDSLLASGSVVLALRYHLVPLDWTLPKPGYNPYQLTLGQMEGMREHMWYWILGPHALQCIDLLITLAMMAGALLLYSTQRDRPEYLWLFLCFGTSVPSALLWWYSRLYSFPMRWHLVDLLNGLEPYLIARMYCAFVGHRIGWKLNLFLIAAGLAQIVFYGANLLGFVSIYSYVIALVPMALLDLVVLPWVFIADIRRGHRETAFLLIPLVLIGIWVAGAAIAIPLTLVPGLRDWAFLFQARWTMAQFGSFFVYYSAVADILSMFSLALIILIRSNRISRQQAVLESEIANAREVQQVIVPEAVEAVPGFHIESVYEPAREVGGDFFQIVPVSNGAFVLVIGDVAGKGLPAAMLVSVLVGAVRTAVHYDHSPVSVLGQLNERLLGRANGGFSTAMVAHIRADGTVTIANAGHPSPYLDGEEVEFPGELPLGVASGVQYVAMHIRLEPASRLTFYSDGVIEAQDKAGQLLGFERARELSTQSAASIAKAAKAFGQQDDITVITVERVAVADTHSVVQRMPVSIQA